MSSETGKSPRALKKQAAEKARQYESSYHGCGQCTLKALQETLGLEDDRVFRAASCLQGGFPAEYRTCGALLAGAMVISLVRGRERLEEGQPGTSRGMREIVRLTGRFREAFGTTLCAEITGGLTGAVMTEKVLDLMQERPELFAGPSQKVVEKCVDTVAMVAEAVVDILLEEPFPGLPPRAG